VVREDADKEDFLFPPECQREIAAGIAGSQLVIIHRAGHDSRTNREPR
jgi:proline iminopeptidase